MLDITVRQILMFWAELEDARNGTNGFGGDTAEIYAYTLRPANPEASAGSPQARYRDGLVAARNLYAVALVFEEMRQCVRFGLVLRAATTADGWASGSQESHCFT